MRDFLEKYPFVESVCIISEATWQPKTSLKFKNGQVVSFTFNADLQAYGIEKIIEKRLEEEIQKYIILQREKKLKRIIQ